jgi:hypothetical protein
MRRLAVNRMAAIASVAGAIVLCAAPAALAQPTQFGISSFTATTSSAQAGGHPDLTAAFALNTEALGNPVGQLRTATVTLPPGLIGNPQAIEKCSEEDFQELHCATTAQVGVLDAAFVVCHGVSTPLQTEAEAGASTITVSSTTGLCASEPDNTITIGTGASAESARIAYVLNETTLALKTPLEHKHLTGETVTHIAQTAAAPIPLFNLQPSPGHVATFGASLLLATILVQVDAQANGQLVATINEVSTLLPLSVSTLTLWGVPADPSHNSLRCDQLGSGCGPSIAPPAPFTTYPANCDGPPLETGLTVESWEGQSATSTTTLPAPTGCEALQLSAGLRVIPKTTQRDTPSGYEIDLEVPQNTEPYELATPNLSSATVTLPPGASLSPGFATGLQTCTDAQLDGNECPSSSMVGTVEVTTPLLPEHLTGALYIATPTGSEKYRLFVHANADGVSIDLTGRIEPNEATGQLTAVLRGVPQLPFSALKLTLFDGPTAPLANPQNCGPATSTAQITTYSGQTSSPTSTFTVDENGHGEACPSSQSFAPMFTAGTTLPLAGAFSPFTLSISRNDGEPDVAWLTAHLPPGLLGLLKSATPCPEPQAAQGACPQASEVGAAAIAAGAGTAPLHASGPVYLTGPYDGAPFGLVTVVGATAGPFDLGTVILRSRVLVNPNNLTLAIATDPLPQILAGIPLRLRTLSITLDHPDFILNPTICATQQITATIADTDGTASTPSVPFAVAGCTGLRFTPRLTASTQANASDRGNGASLDLSITNPAHSNATVRSIIIELPRALRPRLSTIQHACLATNDTLVPSACPPESRIGTATVSTPMLSAPLQGAIYLVAHGGSTLPSLVLLLQGDGVQAELTGSLAINRKGSISAAFRTLPDAPIDAFQLNMPRGPHSILGASTNPCAGRLGLPYRLTSQNGKQINATARVAVSGCPRHRSKGIRHRAKGNSRGN